MSRTLRSFGAVGDGVTDDSEAVGLALSYLLSPEAQSDGGLDFEGLSYLVNKSLPERFCAGPDVTGGFRVLNG